MGRNSATAGEPNERSGPRVAVRVVVDAGDDDLGLAVDARAGRVAAGHLDDGFDREVALLVAAVVLVDEDVHDYDDGDNEDDGHCCMR